MGRPSTKKINLKDGFYIEVSPKFGGSGIKISRESKNQAMALMEDYNKTKSVKYLGEVKNGKFVS